MNLAVFDVDGTLLSNLAGEDACYEHALREELSLATLDTDWASYLHVSDDGIATEAYWRAFARSPTTAERQATIERFVALLQIANQTSAPIAPMRGAVELLDTLRARGWAVALATGAWRRAAEYKLSAAGMRIVGLPLATSEDGPARVAIVQRAMERAQAVFGVHAFDRVIAVGDGVWDVDTARTLQLSFVGVGVGPSVDRLRAEGASHIIADFTDLEGTLRVFDVATVPGRVNGSDDT
ncbi:HAD family hydrolase [Gemmatimonas sp.]|uniref:HAD family hydrolase n=1 Tax=Gemmatimonas sp. TaxID=1962908 RepID=UPI00286E98B9|nr:HAD family hydrolase [Gemmatimonas sp.]